MSGMLITHRGAVRVDKADLYCIEPPPPTATWKPIKHGVLVDNLVAVLKARGLAIRKEEYAIQRAGQILFGVLDLAWGETDEFYAALGLRTSNNKQFCIQIAVGARVVVCDNLLLSGEFIALKRKHTAHLDLMGELIEGIHKFELGYRAYRKHIEMLQSLFLSPKEARERIYEAFARRIVPVRLFTDVALPYLERVETTTSWELLNRFTGATKKLNPSMQFAATMQLGSFFRRTEQRRSFPLSLPLPREAEAVNRA